MGTQESKPVLLDLFCGAGGAAAGFTRAGWEVVGVDSQPQPHYPYLFIQADATAFPLRGFDAIFAAPPRGAGRTAAQETDPEVISLMRKRLNDSGKVWLIEATENAALPDAVTLCGRMFDREVYRHRQYDANWPIISPDHPEHTTPQARAGHWQPGEIVNIAGTCAPITLARAVMGISWMTREELVDATPPVYTEFLGRQLIDYVRPAGLFVPYPRWHR